MAQRVMIAMAFSSTPDLLIADEPTTALDVTMQAQILELMENLTKKFSTSVLLITHNLSVVAETCDRIAVMYAGKIVETANVEKIFEEPAHPYTKSLIDAIPTFGTMKRKILQTIPGSVPSLIDPPTGCRFHPRCKFASEICRKNEPNSIMLSQSHTVSCHLYCDKD
jgi:oligopeptide/dipeptide ABC transporter ATP-binding protein